MRRLQPPLDGGVSDARGAPSRGQEDEAPREDVGRYAHDQTGGEEDDEQGAALRLVAEVGARHDQLDDGVVHLAEVLHAVLQVPHVVEEIPAQLLHGLDGDGGRDGRAARRVPEGQLVRQVELGRRVARDETRDEDADEQDD